jgi:hypothetical protein
MVSITVMIEHLGSSSLLSGFEDKSEVRLDRLMVPMVNSQYT